jgi:signal transduction histidine kinase
MVLDTSWRSNNMRRLSWKLWGSLFLIVVVTVGLMVFLTNRSTTREFHQYVLSSNMMYTEVVGENIGQFYAQQHDWEGIQDLLASQLLSQNDRLVVADGTGTIVGDTKDALLGENAEKLGLENGIPVTVSGQTVGTLYYLCSGPGSGMGRMQGRGCPGSMVLSTGEQDFLDRVTGYLWIAGVIAVAAALLLGLLLTRQITTPVRALTEGARNIAKGDLGYRLNIKAKDEIGELANSFNAMAASLDAAEQSRRRLNADIAHELRTPLTVIEGTVDGILDGVFEADREHLDSIKEQTALLSRLTHDLRDLSLAESGQLKLERVPLDIIDLVQRKLIRYEVKAREKEISLKFSASSDIPTVDGDRLRIEQVISNLLENAIRYTPDGGSITASIQTVKNDPAHNIGQESVIISFTDTGKGIPPEYLPHVYERFYRIDTSRSRSEGGVGLGLAIVKQIILAHGGQVWAESKPGKGSTFFIALPLTTGT